MQALHATRRWAALLRPIGIVEKGDGARQPRDRCSELNVEGVAHSPHQYTEATQHHEVVVLFHDRIATIHLLNKQISDNSDEKRKSTLSEIEKKYYAEFLVGK